ncbi:MAG: hypothetical protein V4486_00650 [Patescibacteria group bacterium]
MDIINKIFSMFSKANNAMMKANSMQYTVNRAESSYNNISKAPSKWKMVIYIVIAIVVILYFIFG